MAWMFSMHADTGHAEEKPVTNDDGFTSMKEHKIRQQHGTAARPHTPPGEESIAQVLGDTTHHRNDSVTGLQGDIFETPDVSEQPMPGIFPNLASRFDLPSVNSTSQTPPTPADDDMNFDFRLEKHTTKTTHSPTKKSDTANTANDPTMDFSTLLIAKPNPFKFNLRIRDQDKADRIARRWMELKMDGEFEDSASFGRTATRAISSMAGVRSSHEDQACSSLLGYNGRLFVV